MNKELLEQICEAILAKSGPHDGLNFCCDGVDVRFETDEVHTVVAVRYVVPGQRPLYEIALEAIANAEQKKEDAFEPFYQARTQTRAAPIAMVSLTLVDGDDGSVYDQVIEMGPGLDKISDGPVDGLYLHQFYKQVDAKHHLGQRTIMIGQIWRAQASDEVLQGLYALLTSATQSTADHQTE
jgi:hypothetical protein